MASAARWITPKSAALSFACGYSDKLRHGETGKGLNDYDAIFRILAEVKYTGWISVEDGVNGMDELQRSVEFLKKKRGEYFHG